MNAGPAALPSTADGTCSATGGYTCELDAQALQRLRQLDPTGSNRLIVRVFAAFETSVLRLRLQLEAAQLTGDAAAIRLVAHTLKSSSASIGALYLSRLCTEIEQLARDQHLAAAIARIGPLLHEADAVLQALHRVPDTGT